MEQAQVTVSVPAGSKALADGIKTLVASVIAQHKAHPGGIVEIGTDIVEAVKDLGPALTKVGAIGEEVSLDPIGVGEAFAIAGFELGRELKNAPAVAMAAAPAAEAASPAPAEGA